MAIRKCKECGTDISTKAKACPQCGAVTKKVGCFSIIGFLFVVVVMIGIVSAIITNSPSPTTTPAADTSPQSPSTQVSHDEPTKPDLEVLDFDWATGEFGNKSLRGTVRNNTKKQYGYVQVEINLYDESGSQVGSTLANINNLEPNGTWKFEAPVLDDKAARAKVKEVTGF